MYPSQVGTNYAVSEPAGRSEELERPTPIRERHRRTRINSFGLTPVTRAAELISPLGSGSMSPVVHAVTVAARPDR